MAEAPPGIRFFFTTSYLAESQVSPSPPVPPLNGDARTRPEPGARRGNRVGGGPVLTILFTISGRTDLRIDVSGVKFDAEADFEVCLPPAPPKPCRNSEKRVFQTD